MCETNILLEDLLNIVAMRLLKNKVAIVTGSSRGIGRGTALEFSREGAKVVINYFRSEEQAQSLKKQIDSEGGTSEIVRADVTKHGEAKHLIEKSLNLFGPIDILVNNAGTTFGKAWGNFETNVPGDWEIVLDNNLKSVLNCTQCVLPNMIEAKRGKVINVVSESGVKGNKRNPVYAAAKGGVIIFTKSIAMQVVKYGITANCIAPGAVSTRASELKAEGKLTVDDYVKEIPMGRMATTEEVAKILAFMASDSTNYMTGQCIVVDGGWTL